MSVFALVLCIVLGIAPCKDGHVINIAYYELPPFIYKGDYGSLVGLIPNSAREITKKCNDLEFNYIESAESAEGFFNLLKNKEKMKRFDAKDTIWLTLTKHVPKSIIDEVGLKSSTAFYSGIDVVVHRDQIGIYAKVKVGIYACRYLFLVGLMLLIIYGRAILFIERW